MLDHLDGGIRANVEHRTVVERDARPRTHLGVYEVLPVHNRLGRGRNGFAAARKVHRRDHPRNLARARPRPRGSCRAIARHRHEPGKQHRQSHGTRRLLDHHLGFSSEHDPIYRCYRRPAELSIALRKPLVHSLPDREDRKGGVVSPRKVRSEEHTSELQSRLHLVCRLLLEKKKNTTHHPTMTSHSLHTPSTPASVPRLSLTPPLVNPTVPPTPNVTCPRPLDTPPNLCINIW